jgi:hypothetical protein
MTDDYRELTHRLFATATAMLEDATELAATGQSPKRRLDELVDLTRQLQATARDIAAIADAAAIVARLRCKPDGKRLRKRPR